MGGEGKGRIGDGLRALAVLGVWIAFEHLPSLGGWQEGVVGFAEAVASVIVVLSVENFLLSAPKFEIKWQLLTPRDEHLDLSGSCTVPVDPVSKSRWFALTVHYEEQGWVASSLATWFARDPKCGLCVAFSPALGYVTWAERPTSGFSVRRSAAADQDVICSWSPPRLRPGRVGGFRLQVEPDLSLGPAEIAVSVHVRSDSWFVRQRCQVVSGVDSIRFHRGVL